MPSANNTDDIDLREIWHACVKGRWLIAGSTTVFGIVALLIALQIPNKYTAEVLLAPAAEEEGATATLASRIGGLASLAGINPRAAMMDRSTLAIEVLKSRVFVNRFVRSHNYVVPLMAGEAWDITQKKWEIDPELYDSSAEKWIRKTKHPRKPEPSDWEIYRRFIKQMDVESDAKTGIVRLRLTSLSPDAAQEWAQNLVSDLNSSIRQRDIDDAKKSIAYLEQQLQKTSVTEMQNIFYQLIEQQTKKIMLAEVRDEYVFKTIDPAVIPEEKSSPKRALIAIGATLSGFIIGLLATIVLHNLKRSL